MNDGAQVIYFAHSATGRCCHMALKRVYIVQATSSTGYVSVPPERPVLLGQDAGAVAQLPPFLLVSNEITLRALLLTRWNYETCIYPPRRSVVMKYTQSCC